jgi:hypothetical protein
MLLRPFVLGRKRLAFASSSTALAFAPSRSYHASYRTARSLLTRVQLRLAGARGLDGCFVSRVSSDEQDGVGLFDA